MKLKLLNLKGEKIKDIEVSKDIFAYESNDNVLRDAIKLSRDSLRQGTSKTKTRAEVRGGGRKPWRQKGTGRARHGSTRSPIWVGGGITFGPQPYNSSIKMNQKERKIALLSALSLKAKDMIVVENLVVSTPKTKEFLDILKNLKLDDQKTLVVVKPLDENIILASRNVTNVVLLEALEINVLDLIAADKLLITEEALKSIEEELK